MSRRKYERTYDKLQKLVGMPLEDFVKNRCYVRFEAGEGMMPLSVEYLGKKGDYGIIAMMHWWEHPSGDLMRDPDMEILIDFKSHTAMPMSMRTDPYGIVTAMHFDDKGRLMVNKNEMDGQETFLNQWLTNIREQRYKEVKRKCGEI